MFIEEKNVSNNPGPVLHFYTAAMIPVVTITHVLSYNMTTYTNKRADR